jgi:hypothetical protein
MQSETQARSLWARYGKWAQSCLAGLLLVGSVAAQEVPPAPLTADSTDNSYYLFDSSRDRSASLVDSQPVNTGVGGMGLVGRGGHVVGPTVGRTDSITYFDLMPYMFVDDTMFFGDLQFNLANNGHIGGSTGLGIRQYFQNLDAVGGLMIAYDHDATRNGASFEQLTIAHEILSEWLDVRTNVYLPFGRTQRLTRTVFEPGSQQFEGNNITFQRRSFTETALRGFENLYTIPLPGQLAQQFNLDFTAGWYHYQAPNTEFVWGYKLRADADVFDRMAHMFVEFTSDATFGSDIIFAADVNYWHDLQPRQRIGNSQYGRMANWVRRNRTVVASSGSFLNARELARKADGTAYSVYHVRRVPGEADRIAPDGSIANPFNFMQEGIDALPFGDIIFVHSDSVFDGTAMPPGVTPNVVLRDNVLVLGEGTPLTLPVLGLTEEIPLPTVSNPVGNRPIITNVTGNAVTFANNARFSGFDLRNITNGSAVVFNNVNRGRMDTVSIDGVTGAGAHGLSFNNSSGVFRINGLSINNTQGDAFRVTGGTANITVGRSLDPTFVNGINNNSGFSFLALDAGGRVEFQQDAMVINDDGGLGIDVRGTVLGASTIDAIFDQVNLANTNQVVASGAIDVINHSGSVVFQRDLLIDGNNGVGINLDGLGPNATFRAQQLVDIQNRNDIGIRMRNFTQGGPIPGSPGQNFRSSAVFQGNVNIAAAAGANPLGAGVDFSTEAGVASFGRNLTITNGGGAGVFVHDIADSASTTGRFDVAGTTFVNGLLGPSVNVVNIFDRDFRATFGGFEIDNRGSLGVNVDSFDGIFQSLGNTNVRNQNLVGASGVRVNLATQNVSFGNINVIDQAGPGPAISITNNQQADLTLAVAQISLAQANVTNSNGAIGLLIHDNDAVTVSGGQIQVDNARGVDIQRNFRVNAAGTQTNGHAVLLQSVDVDGADFGIFVQDSRGAFQVTGTPVNRPAPGSGGTISNSTQAGAFFQNTQIVGLGGMIFEDNFRGIVADDMLTRLDLALPILQINDTTVQDSNREGLLVRNVYDTRIIRSDFLTNGLTGLDNQIEWVATRSLPTVLNPRQYQLLIQDTVVRDSATQTIVRGGAGAPEPNRHMVYVHSGDSTSSAAVFGPPPAGPGITPIGATDILSMRITDTFPLTDALNNRSEFLSNRSVNLSAVDVNWNGEFRATIENTLFDVIPAQANGLSFNVNGVSDIVIRSNEFDMRGDNNRAIVGVFNGAAALEIADHFRTDPTTQQVLTGTGFDMRGINSNAIELEFRDDQNNVFIRNNLIEFTGLNLNPIGAGSNRAGIVFNRIVGPSFVEFSNNLIELGAAPGTATGIAFLSIDGTVNVTSLTDNTISANGSIFTFIVPFFPQLPDPRINGTVLINGGSISSP